MLLAERIVSRRRHGSGFATATVLGILSVIGVLTVAALHDSLFGEQLAGSRLLQQRAMALAEQGITVGILRIGELEQPTAFALSQTPDPDAPDTIRIVVRHLASSPAPAAVSADRFLTHHFQIESTGHTARGVQARLFQGVDRVMSTAPVQMESAP